MEVMPGYKKTDFGLVPEEWSVKPLRDIFTLKNGFAFNSQYFSSTGPVLLTPGNFRLDGGLYFEDRNTKHYSGSYPENMKFSRGDLLVVMTDLTPNCNLLGKPAIIDSDEIILHNQRIGKVIFNKNLVQQKFLYYLLLSTKYLSRVKEQATGSTVRHTSNKSIYNIELPFAHLPEQNAIAAALSDVDALLYSIDRLIAKKRDLKQAAMQQLLTGQTRLPGFSGEWISKRLGDTATLKARIGWQGLTTAEYLGAGDFILVTGTEFSKGYVDWDSCHYVEESRYKQDVNIQLHLRDVLVTKDGTIGKVALVTSLPLPATLNSGVFVIRPLRESFVAEFFYYVLCSEQFSVFLSQLAAGSTISHLYQKDFVTFTYRLPSSLMEQSAILKVLTEIDIELAALEQRRKKTAALKQGMMQELLTGKTRLV